MPEETSDCKSDCNGGRPGELPDGSETMHPMHRLPTLQRHALCRIFDRAEFTPDEVALLGYRRLHQADGIGQKGLTEIAAWLKCYGFELAPPEPGPVSYQPISGATRRKIELAVRLLRTHGYSVQARADSAGTATPSPADGKAY